MKQPTNFRFRSQHEQDTVEEMMFKVLGFESTEARNSDSLDFKECGVVSVRLAITLAYRLGVQEGHLEMTRGRVA